MYRRLIIGLAAGLAFTGPVLADTLVVPIDHSARLSVAGSAYSVLVGSPEVADVTVVDSHTLFVQGRGYGQTDVVVLNERGDTLYSGEVVVSAPSSQVSIYRGSQRTDLACAPGCQVSVRSPTNPSSSGGGGGGSPAANASPTPMGAAANLAAAASAATP